jgi:O-acetyl-ADP-ribose deacetylase (regulator of RNase III)
MKARLGITEEENGKCRVTPAFALPAKYMFHTVGPCLERNQREPNPVQQRELVGCYKSCLDAAKGMPDVKSLAYCCVSTGIFGYPAEEAAVIACSTVKRWLDANPDHDITVVFNVFLDSDFAIYQKILPQVFVSN